MDEKKKGAKLNQGQKGGAKPQLDTEEMLKNLMDEALKAVERTEKKAMKREGTNESASKAQAENVGGLAELPEEDLVEVEESVASEEVEELKRELEEYKRRSEEYYNKLLRIAADFDNFRKRAVQEKSRIIETANEKLFLELLPVLDNFERALAHIKTNEGGSESALQGIEMIFNQIMDILAKFGLKRFSAKGEKFDPQYHQAVAVQNTSDAEPDTVVDEYAPGYMLHSKLLRPAMVVVAKPEPNARQQNGGDGEVAETLSEEVD